MPETTESPAIPLKSIATLFLKLGTLGFGGPAAHIAMMEEEVVSRRGWLSRENFLDLLGATHLIPGPNSTEMAIHIGYRIGGWIGLVCAGFCFILPAVAITGALAWGYVHWGHLPQMAPLLAGVKPIVVAVIAAALLKLGRTALKDWRLLLVGVAVAAVAHREGLQIPALLGGGIVGMVWIRAKNPTGGAVWVGITTGLSVTAARASALTAPLAAVSAAGAATAPLWTLAVFFLKVGAVLFGSGYVLIAFLEGGLVDDLGLLSQKQLMDAVAVGQFTPGPVLSTATFIGYVIAGPLGAVAATAAIFLPSFLYVLAVNPLIPRLRESLWASAFFDAVNASAVGLMVAVTVKLGLGSLVNPISCFMAAVALALIWFRGIHSGWLVVAGAVTGYLIAT